jgi:hypothetical protein
MPMLGLGTGTKWPGRREAITPRAIAMGQGDAYLLAINRTISEWGKPIYLRPFGEMNGHWNFYCAYTRSGRLKGPSHSTAIFRKAFARVYLIAHGGTAEEINTKLRRLGLPGINADLPENPYPRLRVIWNPQGYGSPDVPGNSAQAYYRATRTWTWSATTSTTSAPRRSGRRTSASTARIRRSRTPSRSGETGASTIPPSSARWRSSCASTAASRCSRISTASPDRCSISGQSRSAARRIAATSPRSVVRAAPPEGQTERPFSTDRRTRSKRAAICGLRRLRQPLSQMRSNEG